MKSLFLAVILSGTAYGQSCPERVMVVNAPGCSSGLDMNAPLRVAYNLPDFDMYFSTASATAAMRSVLKLDVFSPTLSVSLLLGRALGSRLAPLAVTAGTSLGNLGWSGYDGSSIDRLSGAINAVAEAAFTPTDRRAAIRVFMSPLGASAAAVKLRFSSEGNLYLGGDVTATERIEVLGNAKVTGSVIASSITVSGFTPGLLKFVCPKLNGQLGTCTLAVLGQNITCPCV